MCGTAQRAVSVNTRKQFTDEPLGGFRYSKVMKKSLLFFLLILNSGFIILHSHSSVYAQTQTHPFLIVKSDDYPALRARATRSPWEEMKTSADNDCMTMVYDPNNYSGNTASPVNQQARYKPWQMRNIVSACALAYILEDPSQQNNNATAYLQKFRDALLQTHKVGTSTISNIDDLRNFQENGGDGWAQQVGVGSALFDMILAYDIFYDGLNTMYPSDRVTIESKFQPFMDYFIQHNENFINKYGILVKWDIFKNNSSLNNDKYKYLSYLFGHDASPSPHDYASGLMNSEGIFKEGMGYAGFRLAHIRDSKSHVIDVLQFTGKDTTLYSDQRLKNFYEWWYGYATTPFGMMATFGDTAAYQGMNSYDWGSTMDTSSHIGAALRYSNLAGEAAMWKNGGKPFPGRLLNYLMMPDPLPTANIPPSKIFPQSGAFFLEHDNTSTKALYGALWNNTASEYHSHKDVNAVYIAAYGEPLLMNSGYNGAGEPGKDNESVMRFTNVVPTVTFSRNYTWDRAVSNNVAMINYTIGNPYNPNGPSQSNDHNTNYGGSTLGYPGTGRLGAGIKEGFAGKGFFDYASGETVYQASCSFCVDTLPNGKHTRNFVFVQPQDGKNGYFVLFDELLVKNGGTGDKVHIVLHPNSDAGTLKTISPATEYSGFVGPYRTINIPPSTVATGIDIFLGTQPSGVTLNDGVFAYWTPYPEDANGYQSFISKYLFSTYPVNSGGKKNVVTVLFPFDETHTKGVMERISGTGYSGAKITQGNILYPIS